MTSKSTPVSKKTGGENTAPLLSAKSGTTPVAKSIAPTKSFQSPKSAASAPKGALPTLDDVEKVAGQALTEEELQRLQSTGALPVGVNMAMNPAMHKVKSGDEEFLVIMVDAPPCGCRKVNGKKERCRLHRAAKRTKKRTKKAKKAKSDGQIRDDDSDRKKLGALRHAEDSEDEADQKIEGAFTPDKIACVGPGGVAFVVPIDVEGNGNAAPRAPDNLKDPIRGILVKGPQDCPQFIPEDKIPKDANGEPTYEKYQAGVLIRNARGEHVFYPDGGCKYDDKGNPINMAGTGVDGNLQDAVGNKLHVAGMVDVNENGMPEFRPIDAQHPAPQDKMATVGVLANNNGEVVFLQTKGQTVGSGDNASPIPATVDGPQPVGKILGHVIMKNGKLEVVPAGQANGAEVVGIIAQGNFNQPVMIVKKGGSLDKPQAVSYDEAAAKAFKENDWKPLVVKNEDMQKEAAPAIENNNIIVAAEMQGKTPDQIRKELVDAKAAGASEEAASTSLFGGFNPNRSVFAYKKTAGQVAAEKRKAAAAGGGGFAVSGQGARGLGEGGAPVPGGFELSVGSKAPNAPETREVVSQAFGGYGGGPVANRSVFAYAAGSAGAKGAAGGGGAIGGFRPANGVGAGYPAGGKDAGSVYAGPGAVGGGPRSVFMTPGGQAAAAAAAAPVARPIGGGASAGGAAGGAIGGSAGGAAGGATGGFVAAGGATGGFVAAGGAGGAAPAKSGSNLVAANGAGGARPGGAAVAGGAGAAGASKSGSNLVAANGAGAARAGGAGAGGAGPGGYDAQSVSCFGPGQGGGAGPRSVFFTAGNVAAAKAAPPKPSGNSQLAAANPNPNQKDGASVYMK